MKEKNQEKGGRTEETAGATAEDTINKKDKPDEIGLLNVGDRQDVINRQE